KIFASARRLIPEDASLLAPETFASQFGHREKLQVFHSAWVHNPAVRARIERAGALRPEDADWILLDLASRRHRESPRTAVEFARERIGAGFHVRFCRSGILVLSRGGEEDADARRGFENAVSTLERRD